MLAAFALAAALVAPPFGDRDLADALGPMQPKPGAWAEYLVRSAPGGEVRVRASVLPAAAEGRCWLEISAAPGSGVIAAARLLVRGSMVPDGVERMYVMIAGQQPLEIPPGRGERPREGSGRDRRPRRLGAERVRVPAGSFSAEVLASPGTRLWRSARVPLWGLVRARSRTRSIELLAFGAGGARSVFPPGWGEAWEKGDQGNGRESAK